ncbi:hypothetical protein NA56DRAFT_713118 [Hyaloscypha hepaticicola]|uniref:Uncharacterized protein n=1 Tax=Hyaloscypha hepaticicola TaxID=2082293 RepID=A0A2J6PEL3_9HELO|nr:hypothetical protein NA56DRAFT_713118 [Hyaloscypha hepaticicola]
MLFFDITFLFIIAGWVGILLMELGMGNGGYGRGHAARIGGMDEFIKNGDAKAELRSQILLSDLIQTL